MDYRLTEAAVEDLRGIVSHIRDVQQSPQNAKRVADRLFAVFERLAATPSLGHLRPELQDDTIRVYAASGVLVRYDPGGRPLTVLRVIHAARDLGRIEPR